MTALVSRIALVRSAAAARMMAGADAEEIRPVVLADAEHFEADLIGKLDLLDQIAQPLRRAQDPAGGGIGRVFDEGVDAYFHDYGTLCGGHDAQPGTNCQR